MVGMPSALLGPPITEFPFWLFFTRESPLIDQSLIKQERLGGTLQHLEQEMKD
jgi:hypothetical protein